MTSDFLPQFRRRLFDWLQVRLADGRTPFRRVEETPEVAVGNRLPPPDLVLWINRDSLLAGAMILVPHRVDQKLLHEGGITAGRLGLRQLVTWGATSVDIWEVVAGVPQRLQSWPIPAAGQASAAAFTETFEQLLQALKNQAVAAMLPAGQLPPDYFANLCRMVLRDMEAGLQEAARVAAPAGQPDGYTSRQARDKGWLSIWRLLALLRYGRIPPGVDPERLERAYSYALAGLDPEIFRQCRPDDSEAPLPESVAVRLHHLAGRLSQLGWQLDSQRAQVTLELLLAETARDCEVDTTPLAEPPRPRALLVNHLPPQLPAAALLLAPRPCLAGLALTSRAAGIPLPAWMADTLEALPADSRPEQVVATLHDREPLPPGERQRRLAALRQPWPYRRFQMAATTPAWVSEALHLGGTVDPAGTLLLTLPPDWPAAPGAELLWQALTERLALAELLLHADGRQTLFLVGQHLAPDLLNLRRPDGSCRRLPALPDGADVAALTALSSADTSPAVALPRQRRAQPQLAAAIAVKVFRDGLPNFPGDYLRRLDPGELRSYPLPGPLHAESQFFQHVYLRGTDGTVVEAANSADAEALVLASRDGRARVDLPVDPTMTARMTAAYQGDLRRLWQALLVECRRHLPVQRQALALARRLWDERGLPTPGSD